MLPYIHAFADRHGKVRRYFRRRGFPLIALSGEPGSAEFHASYSAALAGCEVRQPIGKGRSPPGSVGAAVAAYYGSNEFAAFARSTQKMRRRILELVRAKHGDKRVATLEPKHVAALISTRPPFEARNWLKTLRGLMQFCAAIGMRAGDPTASIKPRKIRGGSRHTWSEDEIAQFETRHPVGTKARLAMALMLYTAQRRSDAVKMGPQHIRDGWLAVQQQKTGTRLMIPVLPELAAIIAASECGHLAFLVTAYGAPFTAAGFGNLFRTWCDEAGLPQCSAHGLRKAALRRLAEGGATGAQLRAWGGHKSLADVEPYIEAADQAKLAEASMERMRNRKVATPAASSGKPVVNE